MLCRELGLEVGGADVHVVHNEDLLQGHVQDQARRRELGVWGERLGEGLAEHLVVAKSDESSFVLVEAAVGIELTL
eukprot:158274-Prorocentrum_minimum.AAC.1